MSFDTTPAKKKNVVSDPYAGQYPPPPPLPKEDMTVEDNRNRHEHRPSYDSGEQQHHEEQRYNEQQYGQPQHYQDQGYSQHHSEEQGYRQPHSIEQRYGNQQEEPQPYFDNGGQYEQQQYDDQQQSQPFYVVSGASVDQSHHNSLASSRYSGNNRQQSFHEDSNSAAHISTHSSHHTIPEPGRGHYYETSIHNTATTDEGGDYYDPEAVNLREYLYAERQAKLRRQEELQEQLNLEQRQQQLNLEQHQQQYAEMDNRHNHPLPRPEPLYYNNSGSTNPSFQNEEQMMYPSPMLMRPPPPMFNSPSNPMFSPRPQSFLPPPPFPPPPPMMQNQSSNPSMLRPPQPMMMPEKYPNHRNSCCFGVSFCAFFWTLILLVFLFGGVALIVASKIIGDKCSADESYKSSNPTLCKQIFHDGFMYGGIVVAGLSLLIVLWRIVRWIWGGSDRIQ